jgi:uracil-DNA glycosylase family 4
MKYPRPDFCQQCPINEFTSGYTPARLIPSGSIQMVGEASGETEIENGVGFSGGSGQWLRNLCKGAKIDFERVSLTNVIGCKPRDNIFPGDPKWEWTSKDIARDGIAYCREHHFWPSIEKANKNKIYAIGAHSLEALTNRKGINVWRGSPLALKDSGSAKPRVIPTLHPAFLMRQAKLASVVIQDLQKALVLPPENYNLFPTLEEVYDWKSNEFSFDLEWNSYGDITLCGLSDRNYSAIVVPFVGGYREALKTKFENSKTLIGHNIIGADLKELEKLGWTIPLDTEILDTMLMQHLIQPDYPHDLGFVASVFTNKVFWKGRWKSNDTEENDEEATIQQWKTWDTPTAIPREYGGYGGCKSADESFRLYNARDTDGEFQIRFPIQRLLERFGLEKVYRHVSVPVAYICRDIGARGFKLDTTRLGEIRTKIDEEIKTLETQLPEGLAPFEERVNCNLPAPEGTYRAISKSCKGTRKSKHNKREITFDTPGEFICPECNRVIKSGKMNLAKIVKGTKLERVVPYNSALQIQEYTKKLNLKDIYDSKSGNVTTGKRARKSWASEHPEFTILGSLKDRITLRNNFARNSLLTEPRMYFNLLVHGTAIGRLSSSGQRRGIDLNVQNQPKDFRIIYIPDFPTWGILDIDLSGAENWITCHLAKDYERWERLNTKDFNEHCAVASLIFGRSVTKAKIDVPFYKVGKITNHGLNYGMGPKHLRENLAAEGFEYSEAEVKEFIAIAKGLNPGTTKWQRETIQIAERDGKLTNAFGRIRWLNTRDMATKALAFLPASTLADMILRMMIAHFPNDPRIFPSIMANQIQVFNPLVKDWILTTQIHDSLILQGPHENRLEQIERTYKIMTQPWAELDGFALKAEVSYSQKSWGEVEKVNFGLD